MINHISFGPEALATLLRALIGPLVIMNPHMNVQNVAIVEPFATGLDWADNVLSSVVVRHMGFHVLELLKCLCTARIGALELLDRGWLAICALEELAPFLIVLYQLIIRVTRPGKSGSLLSL